MPEPEVLRHRIKAFYGDTARTSGWIDVDQRLIDQFAESTRDWDWLHIDPERARQDSPFGGTIAHGFWTLSMLTCLHRQMAGRDYPEGALYGLNYGFDKVRLIAPVRVGSRIRCHVRLLDVSDRGPGRFLVKTENEVEVEREEKPALVAEWLFLLVFGESER